MVFLMEIRLDKLKIISNFQIENLAVKILSENLFWIKKQQQNKSLK